MAVKRTPKKKEETAAPAKVEATEGTPKKVAKPKSNPKETASAAPTPGPAPEPKTTRTKAKPKAPAAKATETKAAPEPSKKADAKAVASKAVASKPASKAAESEPARKPAVKKAETKAAEPEPIDKATAKKVIAPIKLTESQNELLKRIGESPEAGYSIGKKIEQRSIDALLERKLIKKGAKDKASGSLRYQISSAGKKHLSP